MVPLNDENKLQVDEKHKKTEKIEKSFRILKMYKIICFETIRYKLNASDAEKLKKNTQKTLQTLRKHKLTNH